MAVQDVKIETNLEIKCKNCAKEEREEGFWQVSERP